MAEKNEIKLILSGDITDELFRNLMDELSLKIDKNIKKLNIVINSSGGDLNTTLGLYDYLRSFKLKIDTQIFGQASSAAILIFLLGEKRSISENSMIFIHEPFLSEGKKSITIGEKKELERLTNIFFEIISKRTKTPLTEIKHLAKKRTFLYPELLRKFKFINE